MRRMWIPLGIVIALLMPSWVTAGDEETAPSAGWAMVASILLPGGGQFYTDNPWRGLVFGVAQSFVLSLMLYEHAQAEEQWIEFRRTGDLRVYDDYYYHAERRNELLWWMGGVWALAIADAYVDAHLWGFDDQEAPLSEQYRLSEKVISTAAEQICITVGEKRRPCPIRGVSRETYRGGSRE